jgi:hypothetical protein
MRNIRRLERMGSVGCKLAVAANSSKVDFDALCELLIELLPVLWSTLLQDSALDLLRREIEERYGERIEEVRQITEELFASDDSSSTRSRTTTSPTDNLRRIRERTRMRISNRFGAVRVASWCH